MAFRDGNNGPELWPYCYRLGVAAIEYRPFDDIDLSRFPVGEPKSAWSELAPTQHASLKRFVHEMKKDDVVYVKEDTRIVGRGVVLGPYHFDKRNRIQGRDGAYWQHQRPVRWDPGFQARRIVLGRDHFTVTPLSDSEVKRIEGTRQERPRMADESDIEGLKSELLTTTRKRSRRLRDMAMESAKGICAVCRRDFTKILSGRGVRVLQVHHLEQLSARNTPAVTRLADLVVVCANCHLLLHLDVRRTLSVDELRGLMQNEGYLKSQ
jgi:hypothetical protein